MRVRLLTALLAFSALSVTAQSSTPPLRDVFRRVRPAVVVVATRQKELAPEGRQGFVDLQGLGSGVVISETGLVLTAAHVVQTAEQIRRDVACVDAAARLRSFWEAPRRVDVGSSRHPFARL